MYLPGHFREDDAARLESLVRDHGFATLVTQSEGAPFASHLPLLLDPGRGPHGTIAGHMARANPQWRGFGPGRTALAVFHGPHCYVSPSWYASAPNVPTWNYAVVHAWGVPRLIDDEGAARAHLERMVEIHEAGFETPWRFESVAEDLVGSLIKAIVAFEMPIERLQGKFKLSQNRPPEDRALVRARLSGADDAAARAVAALMGERA